MNIRLSGSREECEAAVEALRTALALRNVSRWYPNRGEAGGRVYVDASIPEAKP